MHKKNINLSGFPLGVARVGGLGSLENNFRPPPSHNQCIPTQINISILCKFLLYQLLLIIIPINNLMYIISTNIYFSNINLFNYIINKKILINII